MAIEAAEKLWPRPVNIHAMRTMNDGLPRVSAGKERERGHGVPTASVGSEAEVQSKDSCIPSVLRPS